LELGQHRPDELRRKPHRTYDDVVVSPPDFFRQKKSAPPIAAAIVAIADLFSPA
jgi:hypothetical protein